MNKQQQQQQQETDEQVAPRSKYITVPNNSLTRFLLYNARPTDRQANGLFGYKRSSSNLDALTGMTLGKRSMPAAMEYLNMEPFYGRHYGMRSIPRMYDLRWAPLDSYEAPVLPADINWGAIISCLRWIPVWEEMWIKARWIIQDCLESTAGEAGKRDWLINGWMDG